MSLCEVCEIFSGIILFFLFISMLFYLIDFFMDIRKRLLEWEIFKKEYGFYFLPHTKVIYDSKIVTKEWVFYHLSDIRSEINALKNQIAEKKKKK